MYYLRLKFEDAALILSNKNSKPQRGRGYTHIANAFGVYNSSEKAREIDYDMPIGISQVSNMLHVMLGYAPKPTYRKSLIKRNEEIYEIAKKARIKYYDNCDENIYEKSEVLQGAKAAFNSNATRTTKIGDKTYQGFYTWSYFLKRFEGFDNGKIHLDNILALFNKTLGCNNVIKEYTFKEFVLAFEKYTRDKNIIDFIKTNPIYFKTGGILLSAMAYVIFKWKITVCKDEVTLKDEVPTGDNISWSQPTPILESKDINQRKAKLSGEIMVEFDNDEIVERLHKCGTLPTLLDGGLVSVISLEKELPFTETIYKLTYREISEQKGVEVTEKQ
jgi:hypothetical protein